MVVYIDVLNCTVGNGMIEAMLEPHLKRKAYASQAEVGISFFILGAVYMVISPIVGLVSSHVYSRIPFRTVRNSHQPPNSNLMT